MALRPWGRAFASWVETSEVYKDVWGGGDDLVAKGCVCAEAVVSNNGGTLDWGEEGVQIALYIGTDRKVYFG